MAVLSLAARIRSIEPICSKDDLKRHLQLAIEIEHATIPPYLTALYSIIRQQNRSTYELVRQVLYEEMLHFALACNLLNAIGGCPRIACPEFIPLYPVKLPQADVDFDVHIERCSISALDTFLKIELPSFPLPRRAADDVGYRTIGEFYENVKAGFKLIAAQIGPAQMFNGPRCFQLTEGYVGPGRPGLVDVFDLPSALAAIDIIIDQGEGTKQSTPQPGTSTREKPHYFLFRDIRDGQILGSGAIMQFDPAAVRPMVRDPRLHGAELSRLSRAFNENYSDLLRDLERTFNGNPCLITDAITQMTALHARAMDLLRIPIGGAETAGPTFEFISNDHS